MKVELIGLIGTCLILVGFTYNDEKKIRLYDMVGSACFVIYGIIISSWSNIILNAVLIMVHIYKLRKLEED